MTTVSTPKYTIPQWKRADKVRHRALITWLDAPSTEARAAYARALGNVRALEREIERDLSERGSGPEVRLSSGVSVPSGELRATWRSLQDLAHGEESGDLLHELLHVARDPRYHTSAHTLKERGLVTHWGMREAVLRSHYTLPEAAQALDMAYSTTYRLIVQQKRLPCIVWERGSRGPYTPSYLIPKHQVHLYKRRAQERAPGGGRPLGRPRISDKYMGRRRNHVRIPRARDFQRCLEMGRQLVAYRKAHGRYPLPGESIEDTPAHSKHSNNREKPTG